MTSQINTFVFAPLFCILLLIAASTVHAHPQDEEIVQDIEQGLMQLDKATMDAEYQAALERKRQRKLAAMGWGERFKLYLVAGIEHIVPKGADHILFVLGLFFASALLVPLLWQVTAFTLAHTVTLGLAIFGLVSIPGSIVEPLIALSIVYVAVENLRQTQPDKKRLILIFAFGLLHGLGFAAVLTEYGLPRQSLVSALLAFNIGVELGQLLVILAAALLFFYWRNRPWYRSRIQIPCSLLIGAMGLYWFIERVAGW